MASLCHEALSQARPHFSAASPGEGGEGTCTPLFSGAWLRAGFFHAPGGDTFGGVILGSLGALALPTVQAEFSSPSLSLFVTPETPSPRPPTKKGLGQPFSQENRPTSGGQS